MGIQKRTPEDVYIGACVCLLLGTEEKNCLETFVFLLYLIEGLFRDKSF